MKRAKPKGGLKLGDGYPVRRVYHRKAHGKKSARLLIKCGDCENKFEIHYGPQGEDLEIHVFSPPSKIGGEFCCHC
jgi:hypothetical protein